MAAVEINLIGFEDILLISNNINSAGSSDAGIKQVISDLKPIFLFWRVIFCHNSPASKLNLSSKRFASLETPVADQILAGFTPLFLRVECSFEGRAGFMYIQKLRLDFKLLKEIRDTGSSKKELKSVFISPCKSAETEDMIGVELHKGK